MQVKRIGAYRGVWRLVDDERQTVSVGLWFDKRRAERAAERWQWTAFEQAPRQVVDL